jgi:hypothetical protein
MYRPFLTGAERYAIGVNEIHIERYIQKREKAEN